MQTSYCFYLIILVLILIPILIKIKNKYSNENFASLGALSQLYSKGPQDSYLTNNDYTYWPSLNYPPYNYMSNFIWNIPTRLPYRYPYPLYGIYPYYY